MANIRPFRGIHYNTASVTDLAKVLTPPYDTLTEEQGQQLRNMGPYNFAHVDLPKTPQDDYQSARKTLEHWREHKILVEENIPSYYWYRQRFTFEGKTYTRDALVAGVQLSPFSEKIIRPHENTHGHAKLDRLHSLRATGLNLSHIFGMVKDDQGLFDQMRAEWEFESPLLQATTQDGTQHGIWRAAQPQNARLESFFSSRPIYIVDGHHRYGSALTYAQEIGALGHPDHPASHALFTICNALDPSLLVLPTHRAVGRLDTHQKEQLKQLRRHFNCQAHDPGLLQSALNEPAPDARFWAYFDGGLFVCTPKSTTQGTALAQLPMHLSDRVLLTDVLGIAESDFGHRIRYEKHAQSLWDRRDDHDLVIFHARPRASDVIQIADSGEFMPPKSTFFYPKLASGVLLRSCQALGG